MLKYFIIITFGFIFLVAVAVFAFLGNFVAPPTIFPVERVIAVERGSSLSAVATTLYQQGVIRSPQAFTLIVKSLTREGRQVMAGLYQFEEPLDAIALARRMTDGKFVDKPVRLTFPEGTSVMQMATLIEQAPLIAFNTEEFVELALPKQGYLFPDTYRVPSAISPLQLVNLMEENFDRRISELTIDLETFGRSLEEVLIMSSLVETEATIYNDRRLIAGVLWKRLDEGWKLEVDVARETYKDLGLPERPIVNPGLKSIEATINPITSDYWFYLADRGGTTYFSTTYAEHKQKIDRHLRLIVPAGEEA